MNEKDKIELSYEQVIKKVNEQALNKVLTQTYNQTVKEAYESILNTNYSSQEHHVDVFAELVNKKRLDICYETARNCITEITDATEKQMEKIGKTLGDFARNNLAREEAYGEIQNKRTEKIDYLLKSYEKVLKEARKTGGSPYPKFLMYSVNATQSLIKENTDTLNTYVASLTKEIKTPEQKHSLDDWEKDSIPEPGTNTGENTIVADEGKKPTARIKRLNEIIMSK